MAKINQYNIDECGLTIMTSISFLVYSLKWKTSAKISSLTSRTWRYQMDSTRDFYFVVLLCFVLSMTQNNERGSSSHMWKAFAQTNPCGSQAPTKDSAWGWPGGGLTPEWGQVQKMLRWDDPHWVSYRFLMPFLALGLGICSSPGL